MKTSPIICALLLGCAGCLALVDASQFERAPAAGRDAGSMDAAVNDSMAPMPDTATMPDTAQTDSAEPLDAPPPPPDTQVGPDTALPDVGVQDTSVGLDTGPGPDTGVGMCPFPLPMPPLMTPPCCTDDADCPVMGGVPLTCRGAACDQGQLGVCFPRPPPGGCFVDADCMSGVCRDGPACGCQVPCSGGMPVPGDCA